jgi:hypothetical protein
LVVQAPPATHAEQTPALQTASAPQVVPFGICAAVSSQVWTPVAQEVTPTRQAFGFSAQGSPATQAEQTPPLQTWSVPHAVPFASGTKVSTQVCAPVAQEVRLCVHAPKAVQSAPATHALQTPVPLQT